MELQTLAGINAAYKSSSLQETRGQLFDLDTTVNLDRLSYLFTYLRDSLLEVLEAMDDLIRIEDSARHLESDPLDQEQISDNVSLIVKKLCSVKSQIKLLKNMPRLVLQDDDLGPAERILNRAYRNIAQFYHKDLRPHLDQRQYLLREESTIVRDKQLKRKLLSMNPSSAVRVISHEGEDPFDKIAAQYDQINPAVFNDLTMLVNSFVNETIYPWLIELGMNLPQRLQIGIAEIPMKDSQSGEQYKVAFTMSPKTAELFNRAASSKEYKEMEDELHQLYTAYLNDRIRPEMDEAVFEDSKISIDFTLDIAIEEESRSYPPEFWAIGPA